MHAVVLEHVLVAELPEAWREQLDPNLLAATGARVTVRIEQEPAQASEVEAFATDDPAFGIWRDRDDMSDVPAYVRRIRMPRFNRDGSRNELP